jgi:aspartyl-tRNA(Asn)/glutamyl-tRNA(Gln) amidotransferase subunit A
MSELIELTAARAADRIRAGELDPAELYDAYLRRARADELNAFTWVADAAPARDGDRDRPLAGVPLAVKDLFCT